MSFVAVSLARKGVSAQSIPCEKTKLEDYEFPEKLKICIMEESTSIDTTGVTISTPLDNNMKEISKEISFLSNVKIRFLPENPAENFPNLMIYGASRCSIEAVSKENFKGLGKLTILYLDFNQLTTIDDKTGSKVSATA